MYLEHFGLKAPPFQFTASPTALFMSRTHREAFAALEWGLLHEPSGLTLLIGDTGTGKTTLVCALLARQYREVHAAYLGNPKLSFSELMGSILSQLGVRGGRSTKGAMFNAFTQYAADLPLSERIAIMIDEAQAMSDETLEDFRLLSNIECHGRKAAQIVLVGQFELARRLAEPSMRQLNERIGARAILLALSALECRDYIEHRLRLCGASSKKIFASRALDYIVRVSGGVPRRINALCHNSLLLAYSRGVKRVELSTAKAAAADYAELTETTKAKVHGGRLAAGLSQGARSLQAVLALAVLGAAGFVSGQLFMKHHAFSHLRSWAVRPASAPYNAPAPVRAIAVGSIDSPKPHGDLVLATLDTPAGGRTGHGSESSVVKTELTAPLPAASKDAKPAPVSAKSQPAAAAASAAAPNSENSRMSKPPEPAAAESAAVKGRYVVVARGDTLAHIAQRHLGSVYRVSSLLELNPNITDASRIYPGEIVNLPDSADDATASSDDKDLE